MAEGTSDEALIPILKWLWRRHHSELIPEFAFADLAATSVQGKALNEKLPLAVELYPCDVLFVHRDADRESPEARLREISEAVAAISPDDRPAAVCVVPVRMTEAWMLFDEKAIRRAAGNPNGTNPLNLPPRKQLESLPDPKQELNTLLTEASDLPARRRARFNPSRAARLVTEFVDDFTPLRQLASFQRLEVELKRVLARWTAASGASSPSS